MGNTALEVEGLSKLYRIGQIGTGSLSNDLNVWWHKFRGRPNPYLKVGETNQREVAGDSKYVWALKDINFSLPQGQVLGIIGNNGAGKSTLLKVISQITAPTSGHVRIRGKIASLLEVGIGFHPELSGRENIFLNGTIMGMTRREIASQLDEIIDFAGVERYIDTPVKRYSSGMYVRLAFAVAAHLSSDILIVDEVLAVGDAAFQKKCMGKLSDIASRQGRTILFVSHNLGALSSLCNQGLIMRNGGMTYFGSINEAVERYLGETAKAHKQVYKAEKIPDTPAYIHSAQIVSRDDQEGMFDVHQQLTLQLKMIVRKPVQGITPYFDLRYKGEVLYRSFASDEDPTVMDTLYPGVYDFAIPLLSPLKKGSYSLDLRILKLSTEFYDEVNNALLFDVDELQDDLALKSYWHKRPGLIAHNQRWDIKRTVLHPSH